MSVPRIDYNMELTPGNRNANSVQRVTDALNRAVVHRGGESQGVMLGHGVFRNTADRDEAFNEIKDTLRTTAGTRGRVAMHECEHGEFTGEANKPCHSVETFSIGIEDDE